MAATYKTSLGDDLVKVAVRQLASSAAFKKPRLARIKKYEDAYAGKFEKQPRVRFNVPIPVFPGMIDTLQADLTDEVQLEFTDKNIADWKSSQKINAAWDDQSVSIRDGGRWQQKFRWARRDLLFSGRGVMKVYGQSDPFAANVDSVSYLDFHCEPKGGGHLETHIFAGQEGIYRTKSQIAANTREGIYDKQQVTRFLAAVAAKDYKSYQASVWTSYSEYMARFSALDLNAENNNFVGEELFHLCEWVLSYKGNRWYLVFEPYSGTWVRCEKLTDVYSNGYFPWVSWSSHENDKLFWNKSFADDIYPEATAIVKLFNQDLENRERRTSNARAYDPKIFKNPQELFEAQAGRDRLVRADTMGGTRKIAEGIYSFETPEIAGTVDLISWLQGTTGTNVGVTDMQQGASQPASKKVRVAYAELQQISKRLSFASKPFLEMTQEIGARFIGVLKDYMTEPLAIRMLGENGYEWDELKRVDLNTKEDLGIKVTSKSAMNEQNESSRALKSDALVTIANSPNVNSRWRDQEILRNGGYKDDEISIALDTSSDFSKTLQAELAQAIQLIMSGKMPKTNYGVDRRFLQNMFDFAIDHKDTPRGARAFPLFEQYIQEHVPIALENVKRRASIGAPAPTDSGGNTPLPQPAKPPVTQQPNAIPQMSGIPGQ